MALASVSVPIPALVLASGPAAHVYDALLHPCGIIAAVVLLGTALYLVLAVAIRACVQEGGYLRAFAVVVLGTAPWSGRVHQLPAGVRDARRRECVVACVRSVELERVPSSMRVRVVQLSPWFSKSSRHETTQAGPSQGVAASEQGANSLSAGTGPQDCMPMAAPMPISMRAEMPLASTSTSSESLQVQHQQQQQQQQQQQSLPAQSPSQSTQLSCCSLHQRSSSLLPSLSVPASSSSAPTMASQHAHSPKQISKSTQGKCHTMLCHAVRSHWTRSTNWLVLLTSVLLFVLGSASMATAAATGTSTKASEWYVVLVSIPVLDKVLPLKNLAGELLHRGYRVGFALPEHCRNWVSDLEQLEFISLGSMAGKGRSAYMDFQELQTIGVYESYAATMRYYASFQRPMLAPLRDDLEDDRPHLVIVDRFTFAGFDACHLLQLPYIVHSSSPLLDMDAPPAIVPAPFSNFSMHTPSVLERCLNSFYRLRFRLTMIPIFKEVNLVRRDHALPSIATKDDLYGQQLVLVDSIFGLEEARMITPQFALIGMMQPRTRSSPQELRQEQDPNRCPMPTRALRGSSTPQALPREFERWLSASARSGLPIVLISFPPEIRLSPEFVTILMDGLEAINARLVWRITLREQSSFHLRSRSRASIYFLSDGNHIVDPLERIMAHTPVSLLITAGGMSAVQHALVAGVPILGMPFSAEQMEVVNMLVRAGAGLQVDGSQFTRDSIHQAAHALMHTTEYASSTAYLGELLKSGGGTSRAADHVESVLESGARHVVPRRNKQPLFKTLLVDVYLIYAVILCGAAVLLRTFFSVLYSIFQIAPDVHLGMSLDDSELMEGHRHDLHHGQQHPDHGHHHAHHHHTPVKEKSV